MASYPHSVLPLEVRDLDFMHDERCLLDVPLLQIDKGELVCIVGPNGAGKSLLLKTLAGLQSSNALLNWGGRPPSREAYARLGMLLQTPVLLRRSVQANIDFALKAQTGLNKAGRLKAINKALSLANMSHLRDSSARLLSGGERQRMALVRALASAPELLLLDEPAASMDPASTAWLENTLREAHCAGLTLVMVTHDLHQARRLATRVVLMHRGKVVEDADKDTFFSRPSSTEAQAFVGGELLF